MNVCMCGNANGRIDVYECVMGDYGWVSMSVYDCL